MKQKVILCIIYSFTQFLNFKLQRNNYKLWISYVEFQLNYQYLKKCVEAGPVTPVQQHWNDNILKMVPERLQQNPALQASIMDLFAEVKQDYNASMKKSMGEDNEMILNIYCFCLYKSLFFLFLFCYKILKKKKKIIKIKSMLQLYIYFAKKKIAESFLIYIILDFNA